MGPAVTEDKNDFWWNWHVWVRLAVTGTSRVHQGNSRSIVRLVFNFWRRSNVAFGQGSHFKNMVIEELRQQLWANHHFSTEYTPWEKDLLDSAVDTYCELPTFPCMNLRFRRSNGQVWSIWSKLSSTVQHQHKKEEWHQSPLWQE